MNKLLLFDIDGTLVGGVKDSALSVGVKSDRFTQAISSLGLDVKHSKDFRGSTDYLILVTLLQDEGWGDEQIKLAMPQLLKELDRVHQKTFRPEDLKLLPGVKELLVALSQHNVVLGLITGNLRPIAKRKLEALGVWSFFSVGGYGDDPHIVRAGLIRTAIKRAGFEDHVEDVYVIGDTQKDIEAANEAGIKNSVGVANGYRNSKEFEAVGARIVLEDFKDTEDVLKRLDVS